MLPEQHSRAAIRLRNLPQPSERTDGCYLIRLVVLLVHSDYFGRCNLLPGTLTG